MAEVFRADQIGSFLRPPNVLAARADHDAGRISDAQLKEIEDQAILGVLEMQQQVGIDVYSDGEFRRSWFSSAFADSIEGIIADPDATFNPSWQGEYGDAANATAASIGFGEQMVASKLRQVRRFTAHESGFLQQHAPGPFKITLPGVMTRAATWYRPGVTDTFYPTREDLVYEVAGMLRNEVRSLIDEGVSYIQLDSLRYVIQLSDARTREQLIAAGEDVETLLDELSSEKTRVRYRIMFRSRRITEQPGSWQMARMSLFRTSPLRRTTARSRASLLGKCW
jgi:5-methyltetrahydropteroyltriglutamate--homocysteine methyltransferase